VPDLQEEVQALRSRPPANLLRSVVPFERRKWSRPHPVELLARDINTIQVRDLVRQIVREELISAGILLTPPLPPPKPKRRGRSAIAG
jgi:hypothetical protein